MTSGLLLLAVFAASNYLPEALAEWLHHSSRAWEYVLQGVEAAALWVALGLHTQHLLARAVCAVGAWEAMQRPAFRLMFPMDRPPAVGGQSLGEALFGMPVVWLNALAALYVACLAQEVQRAAGTR